MQILSLLNRHLERTADTNEAAMIQQTIAFVEQYPDQCFDRTLLVGHITASVWVLNQNHTKTLLTHHKKLDRWFQLGGHCDGNSDVLQAAQRELEEESGLKVLKLISPEIFDLDVHLIPENKKEPAHYHYDVRFLFKANDTEQIVISAESKDLQWIDLQDVISLNDSESIMRMVRKSLT